MRVAFTGGGSGGHVFPNIAVFKLLIDKGYCQSEDLLYIGTNTGFERTILQNEPITYKGITCGKLRRYASFQNFIDISKTATGIVQSFFILNAFKPDVLFAKGGYVSLPVVFASWLKRIPIVIHESDIHPGLANRLSAVFANVICISSKETQTYFAQNKTRLTGIPLRQDLHAGDKERARKLTGLLENIPTILFMGGGKGDPCINTLVDSNLQKLITEFQVIHLSGSSFSPLVSTEIKHRNRYARFDMLTNEMPDVYALADVIVSRAGASTLAEIAELQKPSIIIPMAKGCSRGEQIVNAKIFSQETGALLLDENECSHRDLSKLIRAQLQQHATRIQAVSPSVAETIVDILIHASTKKRSLRIFVSLIFQKLVSLTLFILCLPFCFIIGVLIALIDGLPIFFAQERIGQKHKPFTLYKFRTLRDGKQTILGHWMRATGLDELPQLWNIMKSDMNLIGPRPLTEHDVMRLGWDDSHYYKRFEMKPGMTGLGQLSPICDKELTWQLDTSYIENQSITTDLNILTKSIIVGMFGKKILKKIL
ncbi:MAG: sugar transferase [Candidatus Uhrbacteria bacterium]